MSRQHAVGVTKEHDVIRRGCRRDWGCLRSDWEDMIVVMTVNDCIFNDDCQIQTE